MWKKEDLFFFCLLSLCWQVHLFTGIRIHFLGLQYIPKMSWDIQPLDWETTVLLNCPFIARHCWICWTTPCYSFYSITFLYRDNYVVQDDLEWLILSLYLPIIDHRGKPAHSNSFSHFIKSGLQDNFMFNPHSHILVDYFFLLDPFRNLPLKRFSAMRLLSNLNTCILKMMLIPKIVLLHLESVLFYLL